MRKTKIVATIGPSSDTEEKIEELLKSGANVFRFNMKHGDVAWHTERIQRAQAVADRLGVPIGILIDLQGPEIRIETRNKEQVPVAAGEEILLSAEFVEGRKGIRVANHLVIEGLKEGDQVLIDDGFQEFVVVRREPEGLVIKSAGDYMISTRKGMNLPGIHLELASLIDDDLMKLDMAASEHVDFVALSFVRTAEDLRILKQEMEKRKISAHVVAKIENAKAIENLDEIIMESDAVMIARGDLGIEIPYEELTYWQKTIIHKCRQSGKAVITATQMLQSMIDSPRPTRAEVSDVANAVFDGSDAVMLSGETAQGKYPGLAVRAMHKIAQFNEEKVTLPPLEESHALSQTESVTRAVTTLLQQKRAFEISALVVFTETGETARKLARFRPNHPIIALTEDEKTRDELCLSYGIHPIVMEFPEGDIVSVDPIIEQLKKMEIVHIGDRLLFVHGHRWKEPGLTNTISLKEVV